MAKSAYKDGYDDFEEGADEYVAPEKESELGRLLKRSPTFAISVFVHAILLFILALIVVGTSGEEDQIARINILPPEIEDYIDIPEPPPPSTVIDRSEDIEDSEPSEPAMVEASDPMDSPSENPSDVPSDVDFTSPSSPIAFGPTGTTSFSPPTGHIPGDDGPFGDRGHGNGGEGTGDGRGSTENSVQAALKWLRRHQDESGSWKAKEFHAECGSQTDYPGKCSNEDGGTDEGWESVDVGVTGLALLAFLGNGNTVSSGPYRRTVQNAVRYLIQVQQPDGLFGPSLDSHANYNHACAAMAIIEAYGMTNLDRLAGPAQNAVDYIARSQNEGLGWRYGVRPGDNDSSVTGWMVLALKSAKVSGLHVPEQCFEGAKRWYEIVTNADYGQVGYTMRDQLNSRLPTANGVPVFENNQALTSVALTANLFMGTPRANSLLERQAGLIARDLPTWQPKRKIDFYYWYYGTLGLFQMGGPWWNIWNEAMKTTLCENQRSDKSCDHGSWDPIGAWGSAGGRVYATAINCLSLEVYYRYKLIQSNRE
ncbi:MAG: hypothetical protein NUW37_01625 [Planctomycetes bacterium]|nr:hypothetical protein [Planctomycetota bacterium]